MSTKPFDSSLKDLLEDYYVHLPALAGPWRYDSVAVIDSDISTLSAQADKVLRLHSASYDWLLHVELQADHELELPKRVHLGSTLLYKRHGLPVRSVIVLLRRAANASTLTGELRLQFPDEDEPYEIFRYRVVRLWEVPVEFLLTGGLGLLPLAPLTDGAASQLPAVIGRMEERLRQDVPPVEADRLRTAAFVLMGLRYPDELIETLYQGVTSMEQSSTYRAIVAKGAKREARKILLLQGSDRFGPPTPETTAALESILDLDRLEQLGCRLLHVSSWEELLGSPE